MCHIAVREQAIPLQRRFRHNDPAMENSFDNPANSFQLNSAPAALSFLSNEDLAQIPNFKRLTDYLSSISDNNKFPDRKNVNPVHIKELLPDLYILDIVRENGDPTDFILRLMGTNVARFYGEHSGESIQAMENKEAIRRIEVCTALVLSEKRNIAVRVNALSTEQQHLNVSVLYCPLAKEDQVINQIIGLAAVRSANSRV